MDRPLHLDLRAVISYDRGARQWLAHCLEFDIVGEGESPEDAAQTLAELCGLYVNRCLEDGDDATMFRPAPPGVFQLYQVGRRRRIRVQLPEAIERMTIHQAKAA